MRSQKGIGLVTLVLIVIVLMLLTGVTTYDAFQDNGAVDQLEKEYIMNESENEVIAK